jgi:exodeoxyribonuclease VII large subunit
MSEILSLYELNMLVREVVEAAFPQTLLVTAEIASCDVKNHCYMTLVDKQDDVVRAEMRAVIWAGRYKVIAPVFEKATGAKLVKGIKILFQATVTFHERYGLKLTINNIDPSYTVGEMAVKRKEILERLAIEELIHRNKELEFPIVPQRIGIISSSTAAGYEDLMNHLMNNVYGYVFTTKLYEAVMQGDRSEASVVDALGRCLEDARLLDVVVIVRGGGGQIDLHCFDSYEIGKAIALLPLPVIAGIGHQRDVTVVDEVANMRVKTPTAAADVLVTKIKDFEDRINSLSHGMVYGVSRLTDATGDALASLSGRLAIATGNELAENYHTLSTFSKGLKYSLKLIQSEKQHLKSKESNINHLDPRNVLKRGYSITYANGKAVKTVSDIDIGNNIRTVLHEGELLSTVESKRKSRRKT